MLHSVSLQSELTSRAGSTVLWLLLGIVSLRAQPIYWFYRLTRIVAFIIPFFYIHVNVFFYNPFLALFKSCALALDSTSEGEIQLITNSALSCDACLYLYTKKGN